MARLVRPTWAIRCVQSGCRCLFEVAQTEDGKQQEVVCPNCGEHLEFDFDDICSCDECSSEECDCEDK